MYDKDALMKAIEKCNQNIKAFEDGIQSEMTYKRELQEYLAAHERYEKAVKEE